MSKIIFPMGYYPDPDKFGTVALGSLYIGDVDTDPTVVGNQKTVTAIQESGTTVGIAQPISLNAGGVPVYAGSVALLTVEGDYSMTVERADSTVAYTIPNASAYTAENILPTATERQILQKGASLWEAVDKDWVSVKDYGAIGNGIADDYDAFVLAIAAGVPLLIPAGTYLIGTDLSTDVTFLFEPGGLLEIAITKTLTVNSFMSALPTQQIFSGAGTITGSRDTGIKHVYAMWFGVPQNSATDSSTEMQAAVDLAQNLDCYIELPSYGAIKWDATIAFKAGKDTAGTGLRYNVLIHGNRCIITQNHNSYGITVVPQCAWGDRASGDASCEFDMENFIMDGSGVSSAGRAILMGLDDFYIEPRSRIGRMADVKAQDYSKEPFYITGTHRLEMRRVTSQGTNSGGLKLEQRVEGFVGGITMYNCEFAGDQTYKPLWITSTGSGAEARGIRAIDCVFYGSHVRITAADNSHSDDIWMVRCAHEGPNFTSGEVALALVCAEDGVMSQVIISEGYFVNALGGNSYITVTGHATATMEGINIGNNRLSLNSGAASADTILLTTAKNVKIHDNIFYTNGASAAGTYSEIGVAADCHSITIQDNQSGSTTPDYFINLVTGCDNLVVSGNLSAAGVTPVNNFAAITTINNQTYADNLESV